ncbi:MAG: nucleotidyltransferase domain-containing protein [Candidatus Njordarchaeia archaeon]
MDKCFDIQGAWNIVDQVKRTLVSLPNELSAHIYSSVVFGSLVRGDFVPGISDIDVFIVFKNNTGEKTINQILNRLYAISEPYRGCSNYEKVLDIPWDFEKNLPFRGREIKPFFKFLGIYAFDFVKYSKVIYGENFIEMLYVPNPKDLIVERAKDILKKLDKYQEEEKNYMIRILAGEAIRLAQLKFGEITIDKRRVFDNFEKFVPYYPMKYFAREIWKEYLTPPQKKYATKVEVDKYILFIKETIKVILEESKGYKPEKENVEQSKF